MTNFWISGLNQTGKGVLALLLEYLYKKNYGRTETFYVVPEPYREYEVSFPRYLDKKLSYIPVWNSIYIFDDLEKTINRSNWKTKGNQPIIDAISLIGAMSAEAKHDKKNIHYNVDLIFISKPDNFFTPFQRFTDFVIETDARYPNILKYHINNIRAKSWVPRYISKEDYFESTIEEQIDVHEQFNCCLMHY